MTNSSFIVTHRSSGVYEAINANLAKYYEITKNLLQNFEYWELVHIEREANEEADSLSKLVSLQTCVPIPVGVYIGYVPSPSCKKDCDGYQHS